MASQSLPLLAPGAHAGGDKVQQAGGLSVFGLAFAVLLDGTGLAQAQSKSAGDNGSMKATDCILPTKGRAYHPGASVKVTAQSFGLPLLGTCAKLEESVNPGATAVRSAVPALETVNPCG
jgi:hypothetical protein